MAGKIVLINGATGGIGKATTIGLATLGARVGTGSRSRAAKRPLQEISRGRSASMIDRRIWSTDRAAGYFLVLGFVTSLAGAVMYTIRGGPSGGTAPSCTLFVFERSFFMADVIATVIGFVLLEGYLNNTDGRVLARTGATTYLFAGIMLVAAEALFLSPGFGPGFEKRGYALIVVCVVLAFLGQAAIGGALLQSGLLAAWIGWVTIVWNLGLLVVLVVITLGDIYFPIVHEIMPLLIGTALLWRRS